ncbi:MAG: T9SS type A sorting domain-containing protein [bacterium]|nr:T9SS type A sorting domain-containing protein [bacterium]
MRCHEARRRISEIGLTDLRDADYQKLLEHLQTCPGCALQAQASQELQQALAQSREHDVEGGLSWSETIARVRSKAALTDAHKPVERPVMAILKSQFTKRPRLSMGICAAVVVLLAVTLIPFKYNRDMGFEVAVAGVDKTVALNSEGISQMMAQLGLEDAVVDVTGCDVTCNLKITELKSPEDAQLVAAAFEEVGKNKFYVNIEFKSEEASGNILEFVRQHNTTIDLETIHEHGEDVHRVLVEKLGEDFGENMVFFSEIHLEGASFDVVEPGSGGTSGELYWVDETSLGDSAKTVIIETMCDGQFTVQETGNLMNSDGEIDEEAVQRLRDMGYNVIITESEDGTGKGIRIEIPVGEESVETDEAAKSSDNLELPEGFALSQNYPNPFNPTTTIEYSLPSDEHVTLEIYNIQGQRVRTLVDEAKGPGDHRIEWDATSDGGSQVATGVYLYRLTAGDQTETKKMSFVK